MIEKVKKIHCIGIGGIGMSALAQFLRAQGKEVSGSDVEESEMTRMFPSLRDESSLSDIDLVIYSDAVQEDNAERVAARARGIPEISYAQALGEVSRDYRTIVVTGTHGKSTTTAMLGLILEAAGFDPLVIVGSKVREWGNSNIRLPKTTSYVLPTTYFIVEGDDYRDHFLELQPYAVVVTSIEWDHPDYFKNLEHTVESFKKLVEKVPRDGFVVINGDDAGCQKLLQDLVQSPSRTTKRLIKCGRDSEVFGKLTLQVPGEFNRYNATAAATCATKLGVAREVVQKVLGEFRGVWRRFEIVGTLPPPLTPPRAGGEISSPLGGEVRRGAITIISDYGHHPTAIRETMKAAREFYSGRRLVLVYQPHQHSRTKYLFNDFVEVLKDAADFTIVSEIYAVKGRMEDRDVNSRDIVNAISRLRNREIANVAYGGNLQETKKLVLNEAKPGDVVIFMGAGDIDNLARELVSSR